MDETEASKLPEAMINFRLLNYYRNDIYIVVQQDFKHLHPNQKICCDLLLVMVLLCLSFADIANVSAYEIRFNSLLQDSAKRMTFCFQVYCTVYNVHRLERLINFSSITILIFSFGFSLCFLNAPTPEILTKVKE